jgi:hypothetical protein
MPIEHLIAHIVVLAVAILETLGIALLLAYSWNRYRLAALLRDAPRQRRVGTSLVVWSVLLVISVVGLVAFHM